MLELTIHPVADMLPGLTTEEFVALKQNIKKEGQIIPILVIDDQIVDGRHRYWACRELNIEPKVQQWTGPEDTQGLIQAAIALNVSRRHLSISQRAALAVELIPMFEDDAKKRMQAGVELSPDEKVHQGRSAHKAAEAFNVNHRYVYYASAIKEWSGELHEKVVQGELSIREAGALMKKQMADSGVETGPEKPAPIPTPKLSWTPGVSYQVLADGKPWASLSFNEEARMWEIGVNE